MKSTQSGVTNEIETAGASGVSEVFKGMQVNKNLRPVCGSQIQIAGFLEQGESYYDVHANKRREDGRLRYSFEEYGKLFGSNDLNE